MITTLYLVRHGQAEGAVESRYIGSSDIPLSEHGKKQIEGLSVRLLEDIKNSAERKKKSYLRNVHNNLSSDEYSNAGLAAIYCSDLSRAVESAEILSVGSGLKPVLVPQFRERSFGKWELMTFSEIKEEYPDEFEAWADNPVRHSPPEGESTVSVRDRVIPVLQDILEIYKGKSILVVAHGGINRIILCHILGLPLENIFRIEQDHAALNIIDFWERYPVVRMING